MTGQNTWNIGENGLINSFSLPPSFTAYFGTLHGVVEYLVDPPALGNQHCYGDGPTHINGRMLHLVVVVVVVVIIIIIIITKTTTIIIVTIKK